MLVKRSAASLAMFACLIAVPTVVFSQDSRKETVPMPTTEASNILSSLVPSTHAQVSRQTVTVDGERAKLTRYERSDRRNAGLGGEHFSTVVDSQGKLKGFANMTLDLVGKPLPTREHTREIAVAFLQKTAPDLLLKMQVSWIEPHDEPIRISRNGRVENVVLTGMKVKARNLADGRWFWVIVGGNEKPMVFERDIVWVTFPGHRKTEKWLHDTWLVENAGAGFSSAGEDK